MIFLDTNIWMNLLVITISDKDYENIQIQKASKFLETNKDTIITCREQQSEADINDYMYLKYCLDNNIKLYTFDKELANNDKNNIVILL